MATLAELATVLGVFGTVAATTMPQILTSLDDNRVSGAARYLASRLAESRTEAVARSRDVALRFTQTNLGYSFRVYVDGNNNGVLTRDIQRGVDKPLRGPEMLSDNFRDVRFGARDDVPVVDGTESAGADPIRFGASNSVSFSALGTATSGTLYLLGGGGAQYAVRVFGVTGKIRVYRFNRATGKWLPA